MISPGDVHRLSEALDHYDPTIRQEAAEQLAAIGPRAQPAVVRLVEACADESAEVCERVVHALEAIGPPAPCDTRLLARLLGSGSADVGYWAATLLGRLGEQAAPAVPALAAAVVAPLDDSVRQRAAWALGKIGAPAREALRTLQETAQDDGDSRLGRLARKAMREISGAG